MPSLYQQDNFARIGIYENDIATLLHYYQTDNTSLRSELSKHMEGNDMLEIKTIVSEIKNRLKRFGNETK